MGVNEGDFQEIMVVERIRESDSRRQDNFSASFFLVSAAESLSKMMNE